jgi:hypothetical protein
MHYMYNTKDIHVKELVDNMLFIVFSAVQLFFNFSPFSLVFAQFSFNFLSSSYAPYDSTQVRKPSLPNHTNFVSGLLVKYSECQGTLTMINLHFL